MKNITFILALLLTSCTKVYQEVWVIERYPIEWEEDIVVTGDHQHYKEENKDWKCIYFESDTVCWHHYDTMVVRTLEKIVRVK